MKKITITAEGKRYTLMFTRKTAASYNQMGYDTEDLGKRPLVAIPPFILCAFKANHDGISQKKVNEIWATVPKNKKPDVLNALITMYTDTYLDLMGDDSATEDDDEGNAASVEFEE